MMNICNEEFWETFLAIMPSLSLCFPIEPRTLLAL